MDKKKIFLSSLLIIGIVLLAIGFFVGTGTETVTSKGLLVPITDNIKEYDAETKTVTLKDDNNKELATIKLLTPINNKVGVGYVRIAEYEVTGKMNITEDFFGEVLTYDGVKYDNGVLESLNKVIDLKYKTTEDYLVDDYTCSPSTSKNGTKSEVCEITGSYTEQREVWLDFDKKTRPMEGEKIIIGLYTTTYQGEVGEWVQSFAGVLVEEWAVWTPDMNVGIIRVYHMDGSGSVVVDATGTSNATSTNTVSGEGLLNEARYFEGTGYITLNDQVFSTSDGTAEYSVMGWWNSTTVSDDLISQYDGTSNRWTFGTGDGNGNLRYWKSSSGSIQATETINDGARHHIGFSKQSNGTVILYLDGAAVKTGTDTNPYADTVTVLGGRTGTSWLDGSQDEIKIWGRVLSPAEFLLDYNEGNGILYIVDFPSDECQFSGFAKDENGDALVGVNITIWNQFNVSEFYENTTIAGGLWTINITNSTNTYMAGAYFNNTLIGQLKPFISGTC